MATRVYTLSEAPGASRHAPSPDRPRGATNPFALIRHSTANPT